MAVRLVEEITARLFDGGESVLGGFGGFSSFVEFGVDLFEASFRITETVYSFVE